MSPKGQINNTPASSGAGWREVQPVTAATSAHPVREERWRRGEERRGGVGRHEEEEEVEEEEDRERQRSMAQT